MGFYTKLIKTHHGAVVAAAAATQTYGKTAAQPHILHTYRKTHARTDTHSGRLTDYFLVVRIAAHSAVGGKNDDGSM